MFGSIYASLSLAADLLRLLPILRSISTIRAGDGVVPGSLAAAQRRQSGEKLAEPNGDE